MFKFLADIFSAIGNFGIGAASTGCAVIWYDEPEMPASLLEK